MAIKVFFNPGGKSPKSPKVETFISGRPEKMIRGFRRVGPFFQRRLQHTIKAQLRGGGGPNQRTGNLLRSIKWQLRRVGGLPQLKVGSDAVYSRIREFGGDIRPVRKSYLTIPFPGIKGFAREYQDTFFHKSAGGTLILMQDTGDGVRPLFTLKKRVHHPKQAWLRPTYLRNRKRMAEMVRNEMNRGLR